MAKKKPVDDCPRLGFGQCSAQERIAALEAERDQLRDVLWRGGFVMCDIPACNCGSWHHKYGLPERFREIADVLAEAGHELCNENGNLPIRALKSLAAERDQLLARIEDTDSACADYAFAGAHTAREIIEKLHDRIRGYKTDRDLLAEANDQLRAELQNSQNRLKASGRAKLREEVSQLRAKLAKCRELLRRAYGYTTAAADLLPEEIKDALAAKE